MPRHREFDEQEVLDAVMNTFWAQGYEGTSIQDLEDATGLTRTSLYNAYGNKRELFDTILDRYRQEVLSRLIDLLNSGNTVREGVDKMLNGALSMHFRKDGPGGCLVVLSVMESAQHDDETNAMLETIVADLQKAVQNRIAADQKSRKLSKKLDARGLAASVTGALAGLLVLGKAGVSRPTLRKSIDATVGLFA
jgi:TetR/AcrR family transcriptional repressor of nem operon